MCKTKPRWACSKYYIKSERAGSSIIMLHDLSSTNLAPFIQLKSCLFFYQSFFFLKYLIFV